MNNVCRIAGAALLAATLGVLPRGAEAATIYVTSTVQKVSSTGGCSLQEAIYPANLHTNLAYSPLYGYIATQCVAGDGNDTIILPAKATLTMLLPIRDQFNYLGLTATPLIFSNITIEANGSTLVWTGGSSHHVRAFAVGPDSVNIPAAGVNVSGVGSLTIRNAYVNQRETQDK